MNRPDIDKDALWDNPKKRKKSPEDLSDSEEDEEKGEKGAKKRGKGGMDAKPKPTIPARLVFYLFGVSCLNLATFGFQEVCLNVPARLIQHYINRSIIYDFGSYYNITSVDTLQLSSLWGAIIAMMPVGAAFGALLAPLLADQYGRKPTLFLVAPIISCFGAIAMYSSHYKILFELLILGRLVSGLSIGLTTTVLPMYLIECTPAHSRGLTCTFQAVGLHIMMTLSFVLSLPMFLGTKTLWGYLLAAQSIPSAVILVLYPFLLETPCYLYTKQNDRSQAIVSILRLMGDIDEKEIDKILVTYEHEVEDMKNRMKLSDVFRDPGLSRAACLSILIGAMRSISGSPIVHSYSTGMFEDVGVPPDVAEYGSLIMGVAVVFCLLSGHLVDRVGRRPLYLGCMGLICMNWAAVYVFQILHRSTWAPWASLVVILFSFVVVYPLGPGSLSWYLASELVPVTARATMAGLSIMTLWIAMLLSVSIFPVLRSSIGEAQTTMVQFLIPTFIGFMILVFTLPETRVKSPESNLRSLSHANISSGSNSDSERGNDEMPDYGSTRNEEHKN